MHTCVLQQHPDPAQTAFDCCISIFFVTGFDPLQNGSAFDHPSIIVPICLIFFHLLYCSQVLTYCVTGHALSLQQMFELLFVG